MDRRWICVIVSFTVSVTFGQQNLSTPATVLNTASSGGEVRFRDTTGHYIALHVPSTVGSNLSWALPPTDNSGIFFSDGSHDISNSVNFTWSNSGQVVTVTGLSGNAAIIVPANSGFVQSAGGFLSDANAYNAFQSVTDGAVLPAYGVTSVAATQKGGYVDYAQVLYPPSGSSPCYDAYGNLATQPIGLTGATFGTYPAYSGTTTYGLYAPVSDGGSIAYYSLSAGNIGHTPSSSPTFWALIGGGATAGSLSDVIVWNGPSPLQGYVGGSPYHIDGTPCATPPITSSLNGLNVSSYVFARLGFATDVSASNAVQVFTGGMQAESYFASGAYYAGTVTNCCGTISTLQHLGGYLALNPTTGVVGGGSGCTSIGSCNNPLIPGETVVEGMLYEESSNHHLSIYDSASWRELAYFNDNVTFGLITGTTFTSTSTGSTTSFHTNNSDFIVDGQGNISLGGTGGSPYNGVIAINSTTGGLNITADIAHNSIQTAGGVGFGANGSLTNTSAASTMLSDGAYFNGTNWTPTKTSASLFEVSAAFSGLFFYYNAGLTVGIPYSATIIDSITNTGATFNNLTLSGISGSTQCLQASTLGVVTGSGAACGGTSYWTQSGTNLYYTTGNVGIGTSSPGTALAVSGGPISSNQTGTAIAFETVNGANNYTQIDGQGDISIGGPGSRLAVNGSTGGIAVTANTALNSIESVGGIAAITTSFSSGGGNCSIFLPGSISSISNCTTGATIWALGQSGGQGLMRLSNGTGTGGLDGDGAQIVATTTSANGNITVNGNGGGFQHTAGTQQAVMSAQFGYSLFTSGGSTLQFEAQAATGKVNVYNAFATAGTGIVPVYYVENPTTFSTSVSGVAMQVGGGTPPAGHYFLYFYGVCVTACTQIGGTVTDVQINWNDSVTSQFVINNISMSNQQPSVFENISMVLNGSTTPTWSLGSIPGSGSVMLSFVLTRLQ